MKTQLVIDGNSILNRSYFGVRPLTTKDGLFTNGVYGFVNVLLGRLEAVKPDYAAVAFDLPRPTFRHIEYAEYKAGRHKMPDELAMQLPWAHRCAEALGFAIIEIAGYEADDILGTLAANAPDDTMTYILTGDRDSLQLINENVHVLLASNTDTSEIDRAAFREKYGVEPEQFVDVKALMGDSSDNIPGVPGIGEKTALKLIAQLGSLDGIYANLDAADAGKAAKGKIADNKELAYKSQFLARIKTDVPLDGIAIEYSGMNRPALAELFTRLEFSGFIKRLALDSDRIEERAVQTAAECSPDELCALKSVAVCLADDGIEVFDGERLLRFNGDIADLKAFFEDKKREFFVHDVKTMRSGLKKYDIEFAEPDAGENIFDVLLAGYVANPSESGYDLDRMSTAYLGKPASANRSETVYGLAKVLNEKLSAEKQDRLLREIELPLASVLCDMEERGFKVDVDGLRAFGERLGAVAEERTEEIYAMTGEVFNINSPKQLGEVLFDKMKLPAPKKTKTGFSTSAEVLEKLRPSTPVIDKIFEYRQVVKLKTTYADGLVAVADSAHRVHTTFNQTVTATGRLSSTEPNLQNIPIRTELGREMRRYFIPENDNYVLVDADYSQIELRLLACISGDERMIKAFLDGDDIHAITASQVFGVPLESVTPELRKRAKAVNFGIVYGIGDFSLAADIGVTRKEAGEYIESYLAKYPSVSAYMTDIKAFARENGFVTTLFGRRRYIPELTSAKQQMRSFGERVAMNSPIQGTAADIIKLAMVNTERALKKSGIDARLILQVHDELLVESNRDCADEAAAILKREMEHAVDFAVPLTVEVSVGENWYS